MGIYKLDDMIHCNHDDEMIYEKEDKKKLETVDQRDQNFDQKRKV